MLQQRMCWSPPTPAAAGGPMAGRPGLLATHNTGCNDCRQYWRLETQCGSPIANFVEKRRNPRVAHPEVPPPGRPPQLTPSMRTSWNPPTSTPPMFHITSLIHPQTIRNRPSIHLRAMLHRPRIDPNSRADPRVNLNQYLIDVQPTPRKQPRDRPRLRRQLTLHQPRLDPQWSFESTLDGRAPDPRFTIAHPKTSTVPIWGPAGSAITRTYTGPE